MEKNLELRMYFFVPYNILEIQKSIQAGHAALEYAYKYGSTEEYKHFIEEWKTWIILDGGTTNSRRDFNGVALGTLNQIADSLLENDIPFSYFEEIDLNDALTALCFLADERVFNKVDYPDFVDYIIKKQGSEGSDYVQIKIKPQEELMQIYSEYYKEWVRLVGGLKNVFLRDLIKNKKLAR